MYTEERVFERLAELCNHSTVIVGVGNTLKGDDGAGPRVCRRLMGKVAAVLIDAGTTPENYIHKIRDHAPHCLLIIDAVDFGAAAGTIAAFTPKEMNSVISSTHALSPRLFVDTVCRDAGTAAYFIGIQPAQTELGCAMSPQVSEAVYRLVRMLTAAFKKGDSLLFVTSHRQQM